jgi:glycosyltransferase involved in cell wall biosynthesis
MKCILYVVSTLEKCGPTTQLYNIISNIDHNIFKVHLVTLSKEIENSKKNEFDQLNVVHHCLNLPFRWSIFKASRQIKQLINSISPNIIHSQGVRADIVSSLLKGYITRVNTIRSFPQVDYISEYGYLYGKCMVFIHMKAIRKMDVVIGVSDAVTHNLTDNFNFENAATVKNGVDVDVFFPVLLKTKYKLRSKYLVEQNASIFLCSGGLIERKNPLFLINAWKQLYRNDNLMHLLIIGDGPLQLKCKQESENFKNIHVLGRVDNVIDYLRICDYYISSSKGEGMPNAALEALSCGLPAILTDIEPHKELVSTFNKSSICYKEGMVDSLKVAIKTIINNNKSALSADARRVAIQEYDSKKMSIKYQNLYLENIN